MTIWPPKKGELVRPAYRSLAKCVLRAIEAGDLTGGDRLPPQRELAYDLGLSVQTVSRAYEDLIRVGAVTGEVGRGTFVNSRQGDARKPHFYLPVNQRETLIDLSALKPVCDQIHIDHMRKALERLSVNLPANTVYSFRPTAANHYYREMAARWLARCGLQPPRETIVTTNGNTSAMTVALMTAAKPGDIVATEEIGHHTLKPQASYLGLRLKGLPIDREGILPDSLDRLCATQPVKALYVMPSGLSPTATVMGAQRRADLVAICRKHDILIIESDAWGPVQPDRLPPLAALAPERSFYFTSLTKCLMPGLRIGYLVVPEMLREAAWNRHLVTNWMATSLMLDIASHWIEDGVAAELLDWQMSALAVRNRIAAEQLAGVPHYSSPGGMHVWLPLPARWDEQAFVDQARQGGVALAPGAYFSTNDEPGAPAVRLCLGAVSEQDLTLGLRIICRILDRQPEFAVPSF